MNNRKLLRSAENLLEAATYQSEVVKSDITQHNMGGYSLTAAAVRFGILRTPSGQTKVFSPDAYFSLENKVRVAIEGIIKEPKTFDEVHQELKKELPKLPENKDEKLLIKAYEKSGRTLAHSILSQLTLDKKVTEEIAQTEDGLITLYRKKD